MNKKTFLARKKSKGFLDPQYNTKEGVIKLNKNNTLQHELAKFFLAWEALQNDQAFVTEAIFKNGKRADLFNLDDCTAYEVLHSETVKYFNSKIESYPVPVKSFKSKEVINHYKKQL